MKKKKTATILALLTGWLGIHRFYLGQPGLGVIYLLLFVFSAGIIPFILGLVDAAMFSTMKEEIFDLKYNRQPYERGERRFERESTSSRRKQRDGRYMDRKREQDREVLRRRTQSRPTSRRTTPSRRSPKVNTSRANPFKQSGVQKFKDYDYDGAIVDFHKAIEINSRDVATHFNLACAYSLNESTVQSIHHLKQAISFGYNNFDNIRNHDALAFLRIQPEYESFEASDFDINKDQDNFATTQTNTSEAPSQQTPSAPPPPEDNLLEQLKKLAELRQKGLLTTEQYAVEKRRLLE